VVFFRPELRTLVLVGFVFTGVPLAGLGLLLDAK